MEDEKYYQRCEVDDPRRCTAITSQGQCRLISIEGTNRCICHGGWHQQKANDASALRRALIVQWRGQVAELADSSDVKSLHNELGILRLLLTRLLNSCKTEQELLMRSASISDLVIRVQKVVDAAHRLDTQMGSMLDKNQLIVFGQIVIELFSKHVPDPDTLQRFSADLTAAVSRPVGSN